MKINYKILSIIILILISSFLIFFSTSNFNVTTKYNFENQIIKLNQNTKLGEVIIENKGIIQSKVYLKNLVGCINSKEYYLNYEESNYENSKIFGSYSTNPFIELKPGKKTIIITNYELFAYKLNLKNNINKLKIYENKDRNSYSYNFCVNKGSIKPLGTIKLIN